MEAASASTEPEARVRELERELQALKAKHEEAKRHWARLEAILDNAPLAIYLKDASFTYLFVNREYERLSARGRAEILGRQDFDVVSPPVAQLFRDQDLEVIARACPVEFTETIPLPDGVHTFVTSKFPLTSESGELTGVAGVCTEITALEQAKVRLEQAQTELLKRERLATLGELSAVIAHEVRNPLGVVFNSLATLKRTLRPDPQSETLLAIIGEEADRLNRMVSALLVLARPAEPHLELSAVEAVANGAIDAARALADPSSEVRLEVPRPVPPAPIDKHLLRQALANLVSNAIQAPRRRTAVTLRVEVEGHRADVLRFDVVDDGAGVPPELVERIFTPFFTTRAAGTGLGLAVVRRVAEAHRGRVEVRPTPGGGATFVLRIPLGPEAVVGPLT